MSSDETLRIATDVGGTFTDLVYLHISKKGNQTIGTAKSDTTPPDYEQGVMGVLKRSALDAATVNFLAHGTTVIINALTERKGAKTGLVTTEGFRDILEIARGNRPDFFNLEYKKPKPFIPRYLRTEVPGRMSYKGEEVKPLDLSSLPEIIENFKSEGVEAVAVCLIDSLAEKLGCSRNDAARGIVRIANNNMVNALKLVSVNRGHDPRDFTMIAFGGGGGMHGCALAKELGIKKVIIPKQSAVFSAWGMLMSVLRRDYIQTRIIELDNPASSEQLNESLEALEKQAIDEFRQESVDTSKVTFLRYGRFRYQNQAHSVEVPLPEGKIEKETVQKIADNFHGAYEKEYTYRLDAPVEIVGFHVVASAGVGKLTLQELPSSGKSAKKAEKQRRKVDFTEEGEHERSAAMKEETYDPITTEIIQSSLQAAADEMFAAMRRTAMSANIAHWNDIGWMTPGSMTAKATEIFQEGLQLPGVKLFSRDSAVTSAQLMLKALTSTDKICNGGTFRPLEVFTREGSVFDPKRPAAMGIYYEIDVRLYDLIWRVLAENMPERLPAGGFASIRGTIFGGTHPDTGRQYSIIEPELGGWGASARMDGNSAIFSGFHGETFNCPAEINEARNGLFVDRMSFHGEEGGEGKYRGGKGVCIEYRIRSDNGWFTAAYTRSKFPPWPLENGRRGSPNYVEIIRTDGSEERYSVANALTLNTDDVIRIMTGTGAGWGRPEERDIERIKDDFKNGFITEKQAQKYYKLDERTK